MKPPTPAAEEFARRLVAHEAGEGPRSEDLAAAAFAVYRKLEDGLQLLIGVAGFHALARRALTLARVDFPFLNGIRVGSEPETVLEGLNGSVQGLEPEEVRGGLVALVANIIGLLVLFVGEELGLRLVRNQWPEIPFGDGPGASWETDG